jgi:hypothetical protein
LALFFMAPWVAEFLLGNLSIAMLPALIVLAPMYGGGALLIRELVRRTGRGWPSILVLGLAYAVFEEAFTTQSLFNPNYLQANLHLLDHAYVPALGMGAWWTLFVLTLHTVWSIGTSIGLVEAFVPARRTLPWLGWPGLIVTCALFVLGAAATTAITFKMDPYIAPAARLFGAAIVVTVLIAIAFLLPKPRDVMRAHGEESASGNAPGPRSTPPRAHIVGACSLAAASIFLVVPPGWGWGAVAVYLVLYVVAIAGVLHWSRSPSWGDSHRLALAGGAALAYAWHGFPQRSAVPGDPRVDLIGNAIFAVMTVALIVAAGRRVVHAEH